MESGFPILTSFGGHVVIIVGHTNATTIDDSAKTENTGFYNSAWLVNRYVVVDDNFFPFQELGYRRDSRYYGNHYRELSNLPSIDGIFAAVVPLPEKAFLPPKHARNYCYSFLNTKEAKSEIDSVRARLGISSNDKLVTRTFLTSSVPFKKRKAQIALNYYGHGIDLCSLHPVDLNLPHFIWVMEISTLSKHIDGFCIGEIVLDASAGAVDCKPIYARIGESLFREGERGADTAQSLLCYKQYSHNLGEH
ncbi:MAG: hypothetical protein AAB353_07770 [Candidatus Hydrogenedentota bacterium]